MELTNGKRNLFFSRNEEAKSRYYTPNYSYDKNNSSLYFLSKKIPPGSIILDLACGQGKLGHILNQEKIPCELYGVELNPVAAKYAAETNLYKDVFVYDVSDWNCSEYFRMHQTISAPNVIVMSDILEHLVDPTEVLIHYFKMMTNDGILLISVPNISHADIGLGLLDGKFYYAHEGILDNTHLKFFTRSSFFQWIDLINEQYSMNLQCKFAGSTFLYTEYLANIRQNNRELFEILALNPDFNALQILFQITNDPQEDSDGKRHEEKEHTAPLYPVIAVVDTLRSRLNNIGQLVEKSDASLISTNEQLWYEDRIAILNEELNQLGDTSFYQQNRINALLEYVSQLEQSLQNQFGIEDKLQEKQTIILQREERIQALLDYVAQLEKAVQDSQASLNHCNEHNEALLAYVAQLEKAVQNSQASLNHCNEHNEALLAYVAQLENAVQDIQHKLSHRDKRIEEFLQYIIQLEEKLEHVENHYGNADAVNRSLDQIQQTLVWKLFLNKRFKR